MAQDISKFLQRPEIRQQFFSTVGKGGAQGWTAGGIRYFLQKFGLVENKIEIIQIPTKENNFVAIIKETIYMKEEDGEIRKYEGLGDASPDSVSRMVQSAIIRMADTRALSRAGKLALGISEVSIEEIADTDWTMPQQLMTPPPPPPPPPEPPKEVQNIDELANRINWMLDVNGITPEEVESLLKDYGHENLREVEFKEALKIMEVIEVKFEENVFNNSTHKTS